MRRKKERSKQGQTNKAKQHSTPKAVNLPKKNELPRVGLETTTLYTDEQANHQLSMKEKAGVMNMYMYSHYIGHI